MSFVLMPTDMPSQVVATWRPMMDGRSVLPTEADCIDALRRADEDRVRVVEFDFAIETLFGVLVVNKNSANP